MTPSSAHLAASPQASSLDALASSDHGYYRQPAIHGERVVFVSEDDLWEVRLSGGFARRLTSASGEAIHPCFSPDGRLLAFSGNEEGPLEVYLMESRGGAARQLTFLGAQSFVVGFTPDGQSVVFRTNFREPFARNFALYSVDVRGGEAQRLEVGPAHAIAFEPGGPGRVIARHADDLARWKGYQGGTAGVLWVDVQGQEQWQRLLPQIAHGLCRPMWIAGRIWFVSDFEGHGNIYSCTPDGQDLCRHTDHTDFYVRFARTDGANIVYACGGDLYVLDVATDTTRRLEIDYASPRTHLKRKFVDAEAYLEDFDLHPKGHSLAVISRGKPYNFGNWEGAVRQSGEEHGVRYRLVRYLQDGQRLVMTSDRSGEEKLEIHTVDGSREPRVVDTAGVDIGRPLELVVAPSGDKVAFSNHRHEVVVVDLAQGQARILDRSEYARISGLCWSPDGRWLAYGCPNHFATSAIRIACLETGEVRQVTTGEFQDIEPVFDPKGRYLYFLSYRYFDPVYGQMFFELSFPRGMKPCLITLRKDVESPFVEKPRPLDADEDEEGSEKDDKDEKDEKDPKDDKSSGQESGEQASRDAGEEDSEGSDDEEESEDEEGEDASPDASPQSAAKDGAPAPEAVHIDWDGIAHRIQSFPVKDATYGNLAATAERVFWTVFPIEGALGKDENEDEPVNGTLKYFSWKALKEKTFARDVGTFTLGSDGKTLALYTEEGLQVVSAQGDGAGLGAEGGEDETPSRESGFVDLMRLSVCVEPRQEWAQMLRESWRLMRDHFWSAQMAGVDWDAVWQRYQGLLPRVLTRAEFSDLVWNMQGELGTSHAYEMGGDYRTPPQYAPGFLGAELVWDADWHWQEPAPAEPQGTSPQAPLAALQGGYRIAHIVRGDIWNPLDSSPLARPGLGVDTADVIVAINGQRVSERVSVEQRLINQAGKDVELVIGPALGEGPLKVCTVRTLRSERGARYREWVELNRARVHEASQGALGYVHIPDMGPAGYAEFHRHYLSENARKGLVVDVRFNGGGHVSQLILEKLARRRLGYDVQRWGRPMPYPQESVHGPLVALTNEHAGSDGDIFSHCFKLMGLGPLIGKRTWGGVVGIWPRHELVDGSVTTQPEFSFWFHDVGFGVENWGTSPDMEVENPPSARHPEADAQLDAAIAQAMDMLKAQSPAMPDFGPAPLLRPPRALGPRRVGPA